MLADLGSADFQKRADALLSLTYYEADRAWIEELLIRLIDNDDEPQIRALAVICLGHVARIHGAITRSRIMPKLLALIDDPDLGERARNALEDISMFARKEP